MSFCSDGNCLRNTTWTETAQRSTTFAFSSRTANSAYSRTNASLLTIQKLSQPTRNDIHAPDLFFALSQFFSHPTLWSDNSTINSVIFDIAASQWEQSRTVGGDVTALDFFRGFLMLPLLLFHANLPLNDPSGPVPGLPSNLYTSLEFASLGSRLLIAPWTAYLYSTIFVVAFLCCIGLFIWDLQGQSPGISGYPLVDFAARICARGMGENSLIPTFANLASTTDIREHLEDVRLYLGKSEPAERGMALGAAERANDFPMIKLA